MRRNRSGSRATTYTIRSARVAVSLISLLVIVGGLLPVVAEAGVIGTILASLAGNIAQASVTSEDGNVQTMPLLKAAMNIDPAPALGGGDISITDDSALVPQEGPSGTIADIEKPKVATVSLYVVQPGDTLSSIAQRFDVTANTIRWANDIPQNGTIHVGDKLTILPITGYSYTVKKGDTLASIAKTYGSTEAEVASYNGVDASSLAVGQQIIIPNGEPPVSAVAKSSSSGRSSARILSSHIATGAIIPDAHNPMEPSHNVGPVGTKSEIDYYISPLSHYIQTQGIHGYNAVDLAAPIGTPIMAAATGNVVVAHAGGWNGGYGSYVVIQHGNGSQTLYGHMSRVSAYDGEHVVQGEVIGYVGTTGESTGAHLHFEIRNGIRNPF